MLRKKRCDPLWEIVGEKVWLQGVKQPEEATCPNCHVRVDLAETPGAGERYRCGLCGALFEVVEAGSVSDDGATQVVTRLAE